MKKIRTIGWAFKLAWKINKKLLLIWFFIMGAISILPAVVLIYNEKIIREINQFLNFGEGGFNNVVPLIVVYGIVFTLVGLSNRFNADLIYMVIFDSYYYGMEELLMDSVQNFSMEELLKKDINDEYYAVVGREGSLTDFFSGFFTLFGKVVSLVSLLIVAARLSIVVMIISVLYIVGIVWLNASYVEKLRYNLDSIRDKERLAGYYENLPLSREAAKEIRINKSSNILLDKWEKAFETIYRYLIKNSFDVELRTFISGLGFYAFLVLMIIYSIFQVENGSMEVESLLVIFTMCMNIYSAVSGIVKNYMVTDRGLYALERQKAIFGNHVLNTSNVSTQENLDKKNNTVFETKNLVYSYGTGKPVLKDVNFALKEGEIVALVGENGSGKSTLVKLLLKLYQPDSGSIKFYGNDYSTLNPKTLRKKIGAFFQDFYLFHTSLKENVGCGDIEEVNDEQKIDQAIALGGVKSFLKKLKFGKDTFIHNWVERSGVEVSGGEKQKIAIARAYMNDKDVYVFDEPASALDPIAELEQFMNIKEKISGKTAILISHRVGFARMADRIVLMDHGEIKESGTHEELMKKNGLYAHFFNEQAIWYQKHKEVVEDNANG